MKRTTTSVSSVQFDNYGAFWMGQVGRIVIKVSPRPRGVWRWDLSGTKRQKRWWGTAKPRYRAMMLGVRYAKEAA